METLRLTAQDFEGGRYTAGKLDFDGNVEIAGRLGTVFFESLCATGYIWAKAGTGIEAGWRITAGGGINVGGEIYAHWEIKAGEGITAGRGIDPGGYMDVKWIKLGRRRLDCVGTQTLSATALRAGRLG